MLQINIPIDVLRKFFASTSRLPEPTARSTNVELAAPQEAPPGPMKSSPEGRTKNAKAAADARHSRPGGSREKQRQIRELWASGKYSSRDLCAEEEYAALGMSFSAARRALRGTSDPYR